MILSERTAVWCAHRMGEARTDFSPERLNQKAYELNRDASNILDTFGKRDFQGFIGFIDLVGFSTCVQGQTPENIEAYLKPFFISMIDILKSNGAMIDKTIGDEIMFCLPDYFADTGIPPWREMALILYDFYNFIDKTSGKYPLRLGLAFGSLCISKLEGDGYSEYTTFGESVHLAKRIQNIDGINSAIQQFGIGGAFGILQREEDSKRKFEVILSYIAGIASKMTYESIVNPSPLKGIDTYYGAIIYPK